MTRHDPHLPDASMAHVIESVRKGWLGKTSSRLRRRLNADAGSITKFSAPVMPRHISRIAIVAVNIVAWFSISNHCALGALITAKTQSAMVPMHCHGNQPSPANKSGKEEMPCCKLLRATVASETKTVQALARDFLPIQTWIAPELFSAPKTLLVPLELDTGPPFAGSFAESVLQRSVLAHAPPFLG
jgi:hypothetical protein